MFAKVLSAAAVLAFSVLADSTTLTAEELKVSSDVAPKCPVSGSAVNKDVATSFNGGDIYFCCSKCQAAFDSESKDQASKANLQLVVTKQAKQKGCPFSGGAVKAETKLAVNGVDVQFCCNGCRSRVAKVDKDNRLGIVFSTAAFKKGFEIAQADDAGKIE